MYNFSFIRPSSLQEAIAILADDGEAQALAGGQTLLPALKQRLARPATLIDLSALQEMHGITVQEDKISIGAMTRHAEVAANTEIQESLAALAHLAGAIGDPPVRNMGTLGGSLANSDPAADYPAAVLGLGASIHTDRRSIAADDYFLGFFETALEPGELIINVDFPIPHKAAYIKFPNPASGYVIVGVFVAEFTDEIRVAINGAGPCVFREISMEDALTENFSTSALEALSVSPEGLNTDLCATAEYRAHLAKVLATRAVQSISG